MHSIQLLRYLCCHKWTALECHTQRDPWLLLISEDSRMLLDTCPSWGQEWGYRSKCSCGKINSELQNCIPSSQPISIFGEQYFPSRKSKIQVQDDWNPPIPSCTTHHCSVCIPLLWLSTISEPVCSISLLLAKLPVINTIHSFTF